MEPDQFDRFVERHQHSLINYLTHLTYSRERAEEIAQDAFVRFYKSSSKCGDDERRLAPYLFRIATNLVRDLRRRPHADETSISGAADAADPRAGDVAAAAARRVDLSRAMTRLKPRERDLLWLAYAQGSSHDEIAAALGLKTSSIKMLLFRARRRLAALLQETNR